MEWKTKLRRSQVTIEMSSRLMSLNWRRGILWRIQGNSKKQNLSAVEDCPTFPVHGQNVKTLVVCRAANKACDNKKARCIGRRFVTNHLHLPTQYQNSWRGSAFLEENCCGWWPDAIEHVRTVASPLNRRHQIWKLDGSIFAETNTEKPVAQVRSTTIRDTIEIPQFAKRPSAGNSDALTKGVY